MAKNGAAKAKKSPSAAKRARRTESSSDGPGHNITAIRKGIVGFAARYNKLLDEKESFSGDKMLECKDLIEEAANRLGCKRNLIRLALKEQRQADKRLKAEKKMEPSEIDELDTLREALGLFADTPLGSAAVAKSEAANGAQAEA